MRALAPPMVVIVLAFEAACSSEDAATPLAAPSDEAGTASSDDVTTTTETLEHEGAARKYLLSVPRDYDASRAYPLYVWLHGNPGSAEGAAAFRLERVTKRDAIIVYPGALGPDWDHGTATADNPDVTFLVALVDALAGKLTIDARRVLLSGWSGGGFMASAVACRYASRFRAIGIHAGGAPYAVSGPSPTCAGASVPTFVTHGTADPVVPFDGGEYAARFWAQRNGCRTTTTRSTPSPCVTYEGCPEGTPVKACFVEGLGHPLWEQAISVEWGWFQALPRP